MSIWLDVSHLVFFAFFWVWSNTNVICFTFIYTDRRPQISESSSSSSQTTKCSSLSFPLSLSLFVCILFILFHM